MRRTILAGGALASTVAVAIMVGALLGLELERVALIGVALGAVVALVPDGHPGWRLAGFVTGFVAAWIGYVLRAAVLPDSTGGLAIADLLVIVICVGAVVAGLGRIPLWSPLVGVASLVGAFEVAYVGAPSQVIDTSMVAATAVLLTSAFGFLAASFFAPGTPSRSAASQAHENDYDSDDDHESFDNVKMEIAK